MSWPALKRTPKKKRRRTAFAVRNARALRKKRARAAETDRMMAMAGNSLGPPDGLAPGGDWYNALLETRAEMPPEAETLQGKPYPKPLQKIVKAEDVDETPLTAEQAQELAAKLLPVIEQLNSNVERVAKIMADIDTIAAVAKHYKGDWAQALAFLKRATINA